MISARLEGTAMGPLVFIGFGLVIGFAWGALVVMLYTVSSEDRDPSLHTCSHG
jgi:hypothetical protein